LTGDTHGNSHASVAKKQQNSFHIKDLAALSRDCC
jgi:hypothetical protein